MNVVVRFAPSPTGTLHVGSVRTTIFNYLFARKNGGKFILRIDDTDKERSKPEYEQEIREGLAWLGLAHDPPVLRQSERTAVYLAAVESMPSQFKYEDFSTEEETLFEREQAKKEGRLPRSIWRDRTVLPEEREKLLAEGRRPAVRFRVPEGETIVVNDLIKGETCFSTDTIEDFVLLRGDGTPSYQLTTVIDDNTQGMTHIIRGEDHVPNTPKQILLQRALDYSTPQYAHVPLVLGVDGHKLSKRHGGTRVLELRERGFLPEAVVNHLALVGWSSADSNETFTPEELIAAFELSRVNKAAAAHDETKMIFLNGYHLHHLPVEKIVHHLAEIGVSESMIGASSDEWREAVEICRSSANDLIELKGLIASLFAENLTYEPEAEAVLAAEEAKKVIVFVKDALSRGVFDPKILSKEAKSTIGVSGKGFFMPLRAVWTGMTHGPELARLTTLLGKDRLAKRTEAALEKLGD